MPGPTNQDGTIAGSVERMDRGNGEWINFGERDRQNTEEELVKRTVVQNVKK